MTSLLEEIFIGLGIVAISVVLAILIFIVVIAKTKLVHNFLRRGVFRYNDVDKILPSGEAWDLSSPSKYGLPASTKAFTIPLLASSPSPYLGAWYMVPDTGTHSHTPTVLYLHGVAHTRGYHYRVSLYKLLLAAGYPVLAIDYRGFADSTEIEDIRESTVVEDAARALRYVRETLGEEKVIVWGHSQGAAIASHMVAQEVEEQHNQVKLILENPFNNMKGQIGATRKWYERLVLSLVGLDNMDIVFRTTHWLPRVKCPVLITHAADDIKIPSSLSQDLFQKTRETKPDISRVQLDSAYGFGHSHTHRYLGLSALVAKFWSGDLGSVSQTVLYTQ